MRSSRTGTQLRTAPRAPAGASAGSARELRLLILLLVVVVPKGARRWLGDGVRVHLVDVAAVALQERTKAE